MHRFYVRQSFTRFCYTKIAAAALFLSSKLEEGEIISSHHLLQLLNNCKLDINSGYYAKKKKEFEIFESTLLATIGFDNVYIAHPHFDIAMYFEKINYFEKFKDSTELPRRAYSMATISLRLTTLCLQYKPAVVACVCINVVSKLNNLKIPRNSEDNQWFALIDPTLTSQILEKITIEFMAELHRCSSNNNRSQSSTSVQRSVPSTSNSQPPCNSKSMTQGSTRSSLTSGNEVSTVGLHPGSSKPKEFILNQKSYEEYKERATKAATSHISSSSHPVNSSSQRIVRSQPSNGIQDLRMQPPPAETPNPTNTLSSSICTPSFGTSCLKTTLPESRLQKGSTSERIPLVGMSMQDARLNTPLEQLAYENVSGKRKWPSSENISPKKYLKALT